MREFIKVYLSINVAPEANAAKKTVSVEKCDKNLTDSFIFPFSSKEK
jgi:hypothetical protein